MKPILLLIIIVCIGAISAHAQSDTITIGKRGRSIYQKDGKPMTIKMLERTLKENGESAMLFKQARSRQGIASGFSFAGGFLLGWELGTSLGGGTVNPVVIGAGVACIGVAIPLTISAQKHMKAAVHTYNNSKRKTGCLRFEPDMYLAFTGNAVGLRVAF